MNDNKNIHGITLIELLVVIGIMGVIGGFVYPTINDWQTNKNIERDLQAYIGLVDYVVNKTKTVGGTGMIYCEIEDENTGNFKYDVALQFGDKLDDHFKEKLKELQEKILNDAVSNSKQWFGRKMSKEERIILRFQFGGR